MPNMITYVYLDLKTSNLIFHSVVYVYHMLSSYLTMTIPFEISVYNFCHSMTFEVFCHLSSSGNRGSRVASSDTSNSSLLYPLRRASTMMMWRLISNFIPLTVFLVPIACRYLYEVLNVVQIRAPYSYTIYYTLETLRISTSLYITGR